MQVRRKSGGYGRIRILKSATGFSAAADFPEVVNFMKRLFLPIRNTFPLPGYIRQTPVSCLSMAAAAVLPAPMAEMTVAAPVTASPPA